MPSNELTKFLLLPKLELIEFQNIQHRNSIHYICKTTGATQFCPHCGLETSKVHDRRVVKIKDAPQSGRVKTLKITKRRFRCVGLGCKKVFTECVQGIAKRARVTERMNREILYTCNKFSNMKEVSKHTKLGNKTIYEKHYRQLELEWRKRKDDEWPKTVGIDEHSWLRNKKYGHREFATVVVDYNNKRVRELIPGRIAGQLSQSLAYIPGRERVKNVVMDLSKPYKSFAKDFFPNAKLIADKFHVVRLLNPAINKYRKQITGDKRKNPIRKLLLKSSIKLDFDTRRVIQKWLKDHPDLEAIYYAKEAIMKLYRCKGKNRASRSLRKLTDVLAVSKIKELQSLRRTLMTWREEI
ncbi:ISL3 family transposase, partial [Halobacteriovorax sp. HLS]|uniref:ISL3 family transposase n=1 Tax=Halobacteriovorax sp. HLS TaxID=2234000 RepID=UPI000FDA19B8